MSSTASAIIPIVDGFKMREALAKKIKTDLRTLLIATAEAVGKQPICWSEVHALLPIPVEKTLAMALLANDAVIDDWNR